MSPWCTLATCPLFQAIVTRIPVCFGDNATISGIASPINAGALLEFLRFVDCHYCFSGASVSLSEAVKRSRAIVLIVFLVGEVRS
jgi:hypothetical protein